MKTVHLYLASGSSQAGGVRHVILSEDGHFEEKEFLAQGNTQVVHAEGGKLYTLWREPDASRHSKLNIYELEEDGTIGGLLESFDTRGNRANFLFPDPADRRVYVTNFGSGSVFVTPDICVPFEGRSVVPGKQDSSHTHFVLPTPDGKYLVIADLGTDKVHLFTRDMKEVYAVKVPAGRGPRQLVWGDDGRTLFCNTELGCTVEVLTYENGTLTHRRSYSTQGEGYRGELSGAVMRKRGDYLYVSCRGSSTIAAFEIRGDELAPAGYYGSLGNRPRDINIWNDILIMADEKSHRVTLHRILQNGGLQAMDGWLDIDTPVGIAVGADADRA